MIRLPPTSLILSPRDIQEYGSRREQQRFLGQPSFQGHGDIGSRRPRIFGDLDNQQRRQQLPRDLDQEGSLESPQSPLEVEGSEDGEIKYVIPGSCEFMVAHALQQEHPLVQYDIYLSLSPEDVRRVNEQFVRSQAIFNEHVHNIPDDISTDELQIALERARSCFSARNHAIRRWIGILRSRDAFSAATPTINESSCSPNDDESEIQESKEPSSTSTDERNLQEAATICARSQGVENDHPIDDDSEIRGEDFPLLPAIASPIDEEIEDTLASYTTMAEDSLPFAPEHASTPTRPHLFDTHRLHPRGPLPRSPLFFSQHPSSSPERPPPISAPTPRESPQENLRETPRIVRNNQLPITPNLTSSLNPRLPIQGTPAILFSNPARRHRTYRPRTISYSYEESERASYAYEQPHNSDSGSADDEEVHHEASTLHVELRGRQLRDSSMDAAIPSSPPVTVSMNDVPASPAEEQEVFYDVSEEITGGYSSISPQLPPPFSAGRRRVSVPSRLPSASILEPDSPAQSPGLRRCPSQELRRQITWSPSSINQDSSPSNDSRHSSLLSLPLRLVAAYRDRSPLDRSMTPSIVPPTRQSRRQHNPELSAQASVPRRNLRVYNDDLAASSQPQTPAHLPDARHQSRFHPSYTAPMLRFARSREQHAETTPRSVQGVRGIRATTVASARRRSDSPAGISTPGFEGLYGGIENTDEQVLFDRAARRLWLRSETRRRVGGGGESEAEGEGDGEVLV